MNGIKLLTPDPALGVAEMPVIGKDGRIPGSIADDGVWGAFDIELSFFEPAEPDAAAAFTAAETFWESRIPGYRVPEAAGVIDLESLEIYVSFADLDGVGGVLGSAGAFGTVRAGAFLLPTSGTMTFDTADVERMINQGSFEAVVRHEMAHVMGFSDFFWADAGAVSGTGEDTTYTGAFALAAYREEFDPSAEFVPVAGLINGRVRPGTSYSHWDEALFANHEAITGNTRNPELMTGFLTIDGAYVSDTTLASFADLGYAVGADLADGAGDTVGQDPASAGEIAVGTSLAGMLEMPGDRDWFAVALEAGARYAFALTGVAGGGGTLGDPLLRLVDAGGGVIASNDDTETVDSRLVFTAPSDGVLYLSAGAFADAGAGSYTLSAELLPPLEINADPVAAPDAARIAHGGTALIDVLANDSDADGGALFLDAVVGAPAHGTARIEAGRLVYAADPGFAGADSLTYRAADGAGGSDTAEVALEVLAAPALPVGVVRGSPEPDLLVPRQGSVYLGGAGPDTFLLSRALEPGELSLIEGDGADSVEILSGLEILQSRFLPDAVELVFDSAAVVRVTEASGLAFEIGANATTATEGATLDLAGLAELFGTTLPEAGETIGGPLVVPEAEEIAAMGDMLEFF